jgi:hypothetical protein
MERNEIMMLLLSMGLVWSLVFVVNTPTTIFVYTVLILVGALGCFFLNLFYISCDYSIAILPPSDLASVSINHGSLL